LNVVARIGNINTNLINYCDDINLLFSSPKHGQDTYCNSVLLIEYIVCMQMTAKLGLNFEKCKIMHFGTNNKKNLYYLNNNGVVQEIERSSLEKDVGIFISDDFK
jgi:hypothetical protein